MGAIHLPPHCPFTQEAPGGLSNEQLVQEKVEGHGAPVALQSLLHDWGVWEGQHRKSMCQAPLAGRRSGDMASAKRGASAFARWSHL